MENEKSETSAASPLQKLVSQDGELNPLKSLGQAMAFWSGDWSLDADHAWMWGIINGWDGDSMTEMKEKHHWDDETVNRLKVLRENYIKLEKIG